MPIISKEKTITRDILSGVGTSAKNEAKRTSRTTGLSKRTGVLYKSITRKVMRSGKGVIVKAKGNKPLTFQIDDNWIRKHEVNLTETDFIVAPARST